MTELDPEASVLKVHCKIIVFLGNRRRTVRSGKPRRQRRAYGPGYRAGREAVAALLGSHDGSVWPE